MKNRNVKNMRPIFGERTNHCTFSLVYYRQSTQRSTSTAIMEQPRHHDFDTLDRIFLKSIGFTNGFIDAIITNRKVAHLIFWILDNSASMRECDGNRLLKDGTKVRALKCTRWEELKETALFHIDLAGSTGAPR